MARKQRERQKVSRNKVSSSVRSTLKSVNVTISRSGRGNKPRSVPISQLSQRSFSARDRALHALADMRHGASISRAARDNGVTPRTIKHYVGAALLQDRPGGSIH